MRAVVMQDIITVLFPLSKYTKVNLSENCCKLRIQCRSEKTVILHFIPLEVAVPI